MRGILKIHGNVHYFVNYRITTVFQRLAKDRKGCKITFEP